ncbi:MAG: glycogen synthase [Ruminococcus callidus]
MKNILFAASECVPFIKTGGLADVVGALPKSLNHNEYDVRVVIPNYTCIPWEYRSQFRYVSHFYMDYGRHVENVHVGIMEYVYEGVHFYFIDNEYYFKCDRPYSDSTQWDIERFIFFSKAVLAAMPVIGFHPDIIHCHDWQTGMIPVFLKSIATHSFYWGTKSIMTIQPEISRAYGTFVTLSTYQPASYMFTPDKLEFRAMPTCSRAVWSARTTSRPSAKPCRRNQDPYYGEQLDGLPHAPVRSAVSLNGIDYEVTIPRPTKDRCTLFRQGCCGKAGKAGSQKELGLPEDENKFMSRLFPV